LWLEDRGWLYYRKKKPSSSPAGCWVGLQQFIEPGVKHVTQIKQEKPGKGEREAVRERLFTLLLAILDTNPVPTEQVRLYLTTAQNAGLDWRGLYEEVVRVTRLLRPEHAPLIPPPEEVAPGE
jgi:hypothetical protein